MLQSDNVTVSAMAGCDPDYGWLPGVDDTKCYMIIKVDNAKHSYSCKDQQNCVSLMFYFYYSYPRGIEMQLDIDNRWITGG